MTSTAGTRTLPTRRRLCESGKSPVARRRTSPAPARKQDGNRAGENGRGVQRAEDGAGQHHEQPQRAIDQRHPQAIDEPRLKRTAREVSAACADDGEVDGNHGSTQGVRLSSTPPRRISRMERPTPGANKLRGSSRKLLRGRGGGCRSGGRERRERRRHRRRQ